MFLKLFIKVCFKTRNILFATFLAQQKNVLKDQELKIDIWRGEKAARPCCLVDMVKRPRPFFLGNVKRVCVCVCVCVCVWLVC